MDKSTIFLMEAGEELDKLVAVEIMAEPAPKFIPEDALELQLAGDPVKSPGECWLCLCEYDRGDVPIWRPLPFSTDVLAAWQVVGRVCNWDVGDNMLILRCQAKDPTSDDPDDTGEWAEVEINGDWGKVLAEGKTAPEAICKAALLTRGMR